MEKTNEWQRLINKSVCHDLKFVLFTSETLNWCQLIIETIRTWNLILEKYLTNFEP